MHDVLPQNFRMYLSAAFEQIASEGTNRVFDACDCEDEAARDQRISKSPTVDNKAGCEHHHPDDLQVGCASCSATHLIMMCDRSQSKYAKKTAPTGVRTR